MSNLSQYTDYAADPNTGDGDFDPLPAGWYPSTIEEANLGQPRSGQGVYLQVKAKVHGPDYSGRVLWVYLNLQNPSQKAAQIGQRQFARLRQAIGRPEMQDTAELIGAYVDCLVDVAWDESVGKNKNKVKSFRECSLAPGAPAAALTTGRALANAQAQGQPPGQPPTAGQGAGLGQPPGQPAAQGVSTAPPQGSGPTQPPDGAHTVANSPPQTGLQQPGGPSQAAQPPAEHAMPDPDQPPPIDDADLPPWEQQR